MLSHSEKQEATNARFHRVIALMERGEEHWRSALRGDPALMSAIKNIGAQELQNVVRYGPPGLADFIRKVQSAASAADQ